MTVATAIAETVEVLPITSTIGAEIRGVDISQELSERTIDAIRAAWLQWRVVVFPGQHNLDKATHIAFGRRFGEVTMAHTLAHRPADADHPEIYELDIQELKRTYKSFQSDLTTPTPYPPSAGEGWHTDMSFNATPPTGSMLRALEVPDHGGDTLFCDLASAYKALSPPVQEMLSTLWAVHTIDRPDTESTSRQVDASAVHPIVRVHPETGERILFVNPGFTSHIVGLSRVESDHILKMCFELLTRQEFVLRVRWQPGTMVFWDNRCTCHFGPVEMGNSNFRRLMNRITIKGDAPTDVFGNASYQLK